MAARATRSLWAIPVALLLALCMGCSSDSTFTSRSPLGEGGAMPMGGTMATGGAVSGGANASGGATPTGGAMNGGTAAGGANNGGTAAGGMSSADGSGGAAAFCPDAPPAMGAACARTDEQPGVTPSLADCSWGDDPRPNCRTTGSCELGKWQITEPSDAACEKPARGEDCGRTPPKSAAPCSEPGASCWYESGERCSCSPCRGGSPYPICQTVDPPQWACSTPPEGCPPVMPQAGAACDESGLSCGPDCERQIVCEDGTWQWRRGICPICAAPNTPIETPDGPRALASIRAGELVYSVNDGAIVAVPVLSVAHTPVSSHQVMRVKLSNGAVLEISAGHPTADGHTFGDLHPGSLLDEQHKVVSATKIPYEHDATYDLLPASDTGTYFAAGAQIGSSLFQR